jgi:hypothetical protein
VIARDEWSGMGRRWGLTEDEWHEARTALAGLLDTAAQTRSTVTYSEAALAAFGGRFSARSGALIDLLGEIDREAWDAKGLMPASLVVRKDTGLPGEGYFRFVGDELGVPMEEREEFWRREVLKVWSTS